MTLKNITNFIKVNNHTNSFVPNVPHIHNVMESPCVDKEIRSFNRKLMKNVKTFKHTTVLEMDRELFTPHGLHLNG
jgi:hypothetical protein